ncbi:glycosyltransferase [uncultured Microbacterium sp.]|uniref:glycosyltransferase n=1 Tax=uncultured Microbacterium sp. TaxID=191216 RepID=UPI0025EAC0C6|nr:glycosyltransferase [uncultured Microbacterium sp.]
MTTPDSAQSERSDLAWPTWCRRVVFVAPRYPEISGGARYVDNFGRALGDIGVDVSVISIYPGTSRPKLRTAVAIDREQLHRYPVLRGRRSPGSRVRAIPRLVYKRWDSLRYRRRLRHMAESYGADSVFIFTHAMAKLTLDETGFLAERSPAVFIGQHHSAFESLGQEPGLRDRILRAFSDVDAFTALSEEDASKFAALLNAPCFGVDNIAGPAERFTAGLQERTRTVIALVRLSHEKQVDVMIRAFATATAVPDLQDWRLEIYGDGESRPELETLIDSLGVGERVRLCGTTDSPARVLGTASLNLLTSQYEGFGYSVLEAAQAGTPSIAFDCSPGLRRLMNDVHGYLVDPEAGEEGYAMRLRELMESPRALADRGKEAVGGVAAYSASRVLAEWARVLGRVRIR